MSKFFKALAQAERDRAVRNGSSAPPAGPEPLFPSLEPENIFRRIDPPLPQDVTWPAAAAAEPDGSVDDHLVSLVAPAAFEAEQYRALRHAIEHQHKVSGLQVVAVSSPCVGDGKTLTAINLAGSLAQTPETRVLLIDADLRRPAVGRHLGFGDGRQRGFANAILNPNLPLEEVVQRRSPFNLSVICAGVTSASPYEILKSPRVGELLQELRRRFDYIVVDTPPLTPVQDCRVLGRWVDGFLVVVAALKTPRRFVDQALTILDRGKILGFIFNGDEDTSVLGGDSHYYGGYLARDQLGPDNLPGTARGLGGRVKDVVARWTLRRR